MREWERFIEEYVNGLKRNHDYYIVRRVAGAGDQGIDIAAFKTKGGFCGEWDYQCKHYQAPLSPSDVYLELGELCHYTFIGDYTTPQNYYFVSPKGVGTRLIKLIRSKIEKLRQALMGNWKRYCESQISFKGAVPLTEDFKQYIEGFDFNRYSDKGLLSFFSHNPDRWGGEFEKEALLKHGVL